MAEDSTRTAIQLYDGTKINEIAFDSGHSTPKYRVFNITTTDGKVCPYGTNVPHGVDHTMVDDLFLKMGQTVSPVGDLEANTIELCTLVRSYEQRDGLNHAQRSTLASISAVISMSKDSLRRAAAIATQPALQSRKLQHLSAARQRHISATATLQGFVRTVSAATMDSDLQSIIRADTLSKMWSKSFNLGLFV